VPSASFPLDIRIWNFPVHLNDASFLRSAGLPHAQTLTHFAVTCFDDAEPVRMTRRCSRHNMLITICGADLQGSNTYRLPCTVSIYRRLITCGNCCVTGLNSVCFCWRDVSAGPVNGVLFCSVVSLWCFVRKVFPPLSGNRLYQVVKLQDSLTLCIKPFSS
jgi:hypothetical protein